MSKEIPSYLRDVLRLIVDGYSHEAISRKLFISTATVHTYVKRLKEYLQDEPELQDFNISPQKALVLIGKRYFEVSNDAYPQNAPSYEIVNTSLSNDEEEAVIPHSLMPEIIASSPYFIDWFTNDLEGISQVRIQGNPLLALEQAAKLANRLREITEKAPFSKYSQELFKIREQVLFEQLTGYCTLAMPSKVLTAVKPIVNELQTIAKRCEDKDLFGLGYYSLADAHYFVKRYDKSRKLITEALKYVQDLDKQLILLRELALDWAYLGEEDEFKRVEDSARKIIASDRFESTRYSHLEKACQMYEGLGRGRGLLCLPKALETLQEGWDMHAKIETINEKAPGLAIQLTCSQLEVMFHMGQTERNAMESVGTRGYSIARKLGYQRYVRKMENFLKRSN